MPHARLLEGETHATAFLAGMSSFTAFSAIAAVETESQILESYTMRLYRVAVLYTIVNLLRHGSDSLIGWALFRPLLRPYPPPPVCS